MKSEFQKEATTASLFAPATHKLTYHATLYADDIRQPWKSVNGFSVTAARLAARQRLILQCREDEIFDFVTRLNELLERPENLNQAFERLRYLEREARQKLAGLVALKKQPLSEDDIEGLVESVAQFLSESTEPTVVSRLKEALTSDNPNSEISGSIEMLIRLQIWLTALKKVKNDGFRVIVYDRYRRPDRPALEARRNEPILRDGQVTPLPAGFLQPARHHLTLWAYLVARSHQGQATVWN